MNHEQITSAKSRTSRQRPAQWYSNDFVSVYYWSSSQRFSEASWRFIIRIKRLLGNEKTSVQRASFSCSQHTAVLRELWLCAEAGGITGMNGCAFALTIALLLVEHTSRAHLEASAHVEASAAGRTAFTNLGDDVMEELARDFERELDVMADELQTVTVAEATASPADGCSSSDEDLRRTLDDQEIRALFEELESPGDGEGAVANVASAMTTKPSVDPAGLGRGRGSARTRRGHEKRRKRRRRTPRRTPSIRGGRSRSEISSSSSSSSTATDRLAGHRRGAEGRSAAGATNSQSAALRHQSRAVRKIAPSSATGSLGAKGTAARRAATATASTATGPRRTAAHGKAGGNARSAAAVQQQRQRRMRYGGVGDHRGSHGFRTATVATAAAEAAAVGTGDAPKRGSEGSRLRRLLGVLLTAAIVAVLSTTVSGQRWPRPLVLVAVPVVHALVAWMANTVRSSSRDRKENLMGAMKITIVLASVIGVYVLTMALTQPLSRLGKKDH